MPPGRPVYCLDLAGAPAHESVATRTLDAGTEQVANLEGGVPMAVMTEEQILAELRKIDTPTITNVVATYPKNPLCLCLYNP